jgi:hypothetical protein
MALGGFSIESKVKLDLKVTYKILKFDEFLAQQDNIDFDFGLSRFLLLDSGPLVKKVGHP